MLMRDFKPAGNMLWAVLLFFAATIGLNGCSDISNAPAPPAPPGALAIATTVLPSGSRGIFYDVTLAPAGGNAPYSWTLSSGSLPTGLTLASSGRISGTPTTVQSTSPTFRLQDSSVPTAEIVTKLFPMLITLVPQPTITTPSPLPNGIVSQPYPSTPLVAVGGTPPYTWSATVTPALPSGLTFDAATATISGTPTAIETNVTHTFSVTDSFFPTPQTVSKGLALTVSPAPLPLAITTNSPLPGGTITQFYSTPLAATGGTAPLTWSLASGSPALPNGLTLNSTTGVLSGTPTTATNVSPIFRVQDSASSPQQSNQKKLSIIIGVPAAPTITTTSLPNGSFNNFYNQTLQVMGGIAPRTWGVIVGALPTGLGLNASTGQISGTATQTGTFSFTVQVTDAISQFDTKALSITITAPSPPAITAPASLPTGTVNQAYPNTTLTASGGTAPLIWDPGVNLALPNGLSWDAFTHTISGIPLNGSQGTANHTFTVRDSTNPVLTATRTYSLTIVLLAPPNITTTSASLLPNGTVTQPYSRTLQRTGGTAPFTWSFTGTLPTGLSLPSTGVISGTPSAAGTFPFTVQVTDALSQTDTQPLSIVIVLPAPPTITTTSLPNGTVLSGYNQFVHASGGTGALAWSSVGSLPTGLNPIDPSTGQITGTPTTTVGSPFNFTVQATDTLNQSATQALSITIVPAPIPLTITTPSPLPDGKVLDDYGTVTPAFTVTLTASGGTPPYTWSSTVFPSLPAGLGIDAAGTISGIPQTGTDSTKKYQFTVTDLVSTSAHATLSLTIAP